MQTLSILSFISFDPSIGKIDKHSLSQQTLMELLVENVANREKICGSKESPKDISEWTGVTLNDTQVTDIFWHHTALEGSISFQWLPSTVRSVVIVLNSLTGTVDFTTLPDVLEVMNLALNRFEGTVDLTKLPPQITELNLFSNKFTGLADFSKLPKSLNILKVGYNQLDGEIYQFDGTLMIEKSYVRDMRKK